MIQFGHSLKEISVLTTENDKIRFTKNKIYQKEHLKGTFEPIYTHFLFTQTKSCFKDSTDLFFPSRGSCSSITGTEGWSCGGPLSVGGSIAFLNRKPRHVGLNEEEGNGWTDGLLN